MMASMFVTSRTHCSVRGFGVFQRNSSIHFITTFQVHSPPACGKDNCVCRAQTCPGHVHVWVDMRVASLAWGPEGWTCCGCPGCRGCQGDAPETAQEWDGHRALAGGLKCCLGIGDFFSPLLSLISVLVLWRKCVLGYVRPLTCIASVLWVAS